jgi:hypothetical protein
MSAMVTEIERKDTGIRMLLTLLFVFILHAVEVVLAVTVLFSLAVALFTKRVVLPACTNLLLESRFDPLRRAYHWTCRSGEPPLSNKKMARLHEKVARSGRSCRSSITCSRSRHQWTRSECPPPLCSTVEENEYGSSH